MMAAVAMRVTGVSFRSLYTDLGFSPRANFMAAGAFTTISSTQRPSVFMARNCPAMGLAEPGPVSTVVTPPSRASRKPRSRGFTPSTARSWGVQGSVDSLPSSASKPRASPNRPRWQWASMKPGRMCPPSASSTSPLYPAGRASMGPTAAILSPSSSTKPRGITGASMGCTTPF